MDTILLYTPGPDQAAARACAESLVETRAAACATLLPGAMSIYRWKGAVETATETVLLAKTSAASAKAARDLIAARHPYDTPCITALQIMTDLSHAPYLAWVAQETDQAA
jgi:periplasmic divalent cation tolerance protein